jgi:hypothetical protein
MQYTRNIVFCQKHEKHESQSVKKTIHIHSKICKKKTQNTDIYKNKFSKAKFYSHKIQSVHLNPNPMKKILMHQKTKIRRPKP